MLVACKLCFEGVRDVIVIQGKAVLGKKQETWAGRDHSHCPSSPRHPTEKEGCLAGLSSYTPVLAEYLRAENSCLPPPGQLSPQKAKGTACLIIKHTVLEGTRIFLCLGQTRLVDQPRHGCPHPGPWQRSPSASKSIREDLENPYVPQNNHVSCL